MLKKITRRLDLLKQVPGPLDVFLFLRILAFSAFATPVLMRLKLPRLEAVLEPGALSHRPDLRKVERIIAYGDTILQVGKPVIPSKCFARGITLYYFLRRAGLAVNLIFGVEKINGQFTGHCWLVRDEIPYLEVQDPRLLYTPTYRFPS